MSAKVQSVDPPVLPFLTFHVRIFGTDVAFIRQMQRLHFYGPGREHEYDPHQTEHFDTDRREYVEIDGEGYLPHVTYSLSAGIPEGNEFSWMLFNDETLVLVMTYNIASRESFEAIEQIYNLIPETQPDRGFWETYTGRRVKPHFQLYEAVVPVKRYPVVLVGGITSNEQPREVETKEAEALAAKHEHWIFAGEVDEGSSPEVDRVFHIACELVHSLRPKPKNTQQSTTDQKTWTFHSFYKAFLRLLPRTREQQAKGE